MRQLLPSLPHDDVTALEALADPPLADGRPAVRICMVQSVDGVVAIDGTSGPLGGPADREFYLACRSLADTVLVGAETVRSEGYGPAKLNPTLVTARLDRGQPPLPRIAVVSRSLRLDLASPFFTQARARPVIVTCDSASPEALRAARTVADIVVAGDEDVDMGRAVRALAVDGARLIGCEGGPTLNGALIRAGLVDELCLSIAPTLVGAGPRLVADLSATMPLRLHALLHCDDAVFMRLRPVRPTNEARAPDGGGGSAE